MDELTRMFAQVLEHCIDQGMELPFILCAAAVNGTVLAFRFHQPGEEMELLAEHSSSDGMMQLPINIMIADQTGEAVQVTLNAEGAAFH
jgi:hypothetical protein